MTPDIEDVQQLKIRLQEAESVSRTFREQLETSEQRLREKEEGHAEQVRVLQAVLCEKDMCFQEQIQKHEEELLRITTQAQNDTELQQALGVAEQRSKELEEMVQSHTQVVDILQQELNSADQQKQILMSQFRLVDQELTEVREQVEEQLSEVRSQVEEKLIEVRRQVEEERQQWVKEADRAKAELVSLKERLEAAVFERDEGQRRNSKSEAGMQADITVLRKRLEARERLNSNEECREGEVLARMEAMEREREEGAHSEGETVALVEVELVALRERQETEGEQKRVAEAMAELWKGLRALAGGEADAEDEWEEPCVSSNPALCMETLRVLEERLKRLRAEWQKSEGRCGQISLAMEALQGELNKTVAEGEESVARIQQLEQKVD